MSPARARELDHALSQLPRISLPKRRGKNGEELATDEAAVWKRVLNFRVASFLKPNAIFESHPGFGISTKLYQAAAPTAVLHNPQTLRHAAHVELADIDPFGQPWDTLLDNREILSKTRVVMVTNGEAYAVVRKWRSAQRFPSAYFGRQMPRWVVEEYLPRLERLVRIPCRFFYVFPTTVRSIHCEVALPETLFFGCPQWMWWLRSPSKAPQL